MEGTGFRLLKLIKINRKYTLALGRDGYFSERWSYIYKFEVNKTLTPRGLRLFNVLHGSDS